ncbi:MAG: AgmX/PglI C-terminal domain-containing protein [Alphaproteobacteria bacterium]|nr:AgmX/PglI C-terminal domain-containing protein [Alphaproteobacteria bacterium]
MRVFIALLVSLVALAFAEDEPDPAPPSGQGKVVQGTRVSTPEERAEQVWGGEGVGPYGVNRATAPQKEWIDTVIRQNYSGVRDCYDLALNRDPQMAGVVRVRMRVETDGSVPWAEIEQSTLGDRHADACILAALKALDYSRVDTHQAGFLVSHSLILVPTHYPTRGQLMKKNLPLVEQCYAQADAGHELRGAVEITLLVANGRVADPRVSLNTTGSAELEDCIAGTFGQWRVQKSLSGRYKVIMQVVPERGVTLFLPD